LKTRILFVVIAVLILIHLVLLVPALQDPSRFQLRDSYDYLDLARTLLSTGQVAGTVYPGVDLLRPPGYPVFLLIGLWLGRGGTGIISVMQVLLLLATSWLLYQICAQTGHR